MLLVSFLSSRLTHGLLEPKEPFDSFVASYQPHSAVPVEFQNHKDSVMRAAGILLVPTLRSRDILQHYNLKKPEVTLFILWMYCSQNVLELYLVKVFIKEKSFGQFFLSKRKSNKTFFEHFSVFHIA